MNVYRRKIKKCFRDSYMNEIRDYGYPILNENRKYREEIGEINKHFEESEKESNKFPKVDGKIVDQKLVDIVSCPVCDCKHSDQIFMKQGFLFVECCLCSQVFVKNRLREDVLQEFYNNSNIGAIDREARKNHKVIDYWTKVYSKYICYLKEAGITQSNLLDIGCGSGAFLEYCKKNTDFKLFANDFSNDFKKVIEEVIPKKNFYYNKKIEDIDFKQKKFGLISLWGVLEHIYEPKKLLVTCNKILQDDGFVLLLIPNIYSRAFKILGINTPTLNPTEHINFFTQKSFEYLCRQVGFEIVDQFQELPIIDLMYPYMDFNADTIKDIINKSESYYFVYILRKKLMF
jgi:2-polyprenyl-3-methyl-5-hydroxy-6-metoxy-1,4-benzoquinol methylase